MIAVDHVLAIGSYDAGVGASLRENLEKHLGVEAKGGTETETLGEAGEKKNAAEVEKLAKAIAAQEKKAAATVEREKLARARDAVIAAEASAKAANIKAAADAKAEAAARAAAKDASDAKIAAEAKASSDAKAAADAARKLLDAKADAERTKLESDKAKAAAAKAAAVVKTANNARAAAAAAKIAAQAKDDAKKAQAAQDQAKAKADQIARAAGEAAKSADVTRIAAEQQVAASLAAKNAYDTALTNSKISLDAARAFEIEAVNKRTERAAAKPPAPLPTPEVVAKDVGTALAVADNARDNAVIDPAAAPVAVVEGKVGPFEFGEIDNGSLFPMAGVIKALRAKEGLDINQVTKGFEEGLRKIVSSTPTISDEGSNSRTRLAIAWLFPDGTVVQTGLQPNNKKVETRTLGGSFSKGMLVQRMAGGGPQSKVKPFDVGGKFPSYPRVTGILGTPCRTSRR